MSDHPPEPEPDIYYPIAGEPPLLQRHEPLAIALLREQRHLLLEIRDLLKDLVRSRNFDERRLRSATIKRIDNSELPAGAPMIYYCRLCGSEMPVHEGHIHPPPTLCGFCIEEGRS